MKIGLASPFMPHDMADLLDDASREQLPGIRGVLATPVTPLAREWHRRGHSLSVFCLDPSVSREHVLRGERLVIHVLPKRANRRCLPDGYRLESRLIRQAVLQERPDVISGQWTYEHSLAALQCGIPTLVTCHDTPLRYAWIINHWYTWYHLAIAWRVIRKADRLVCVSPYTAQHIRRLFFPRGRVEVVPNGLLPEVFERGKRRMASSRPERPFTFCSAGNWGRLKNLSVLLKAFALVRRREPATRLVLFGRDLGRGQPAEQWARRLNLERNVEFAGAVSRETVLDFLEREADMMAHPSLIETHGMILIEAMACGVPVLGYQHGGAVPWTLEDGKVGFLCDTRDVTAVADHMLAAIHEPTRNRGLVERAWTSVSSRFRLADAASANERILRELAGTAQPIDSR